MADITTTECEDEALVSAGRGARRRGACSSRTCPSTACAASTSAGRGLGPVPPGVGATRVLRRAAVPLRHPAAVVPARTGGCSPWCQSLGDEPTARGTPASTPASTTRRCPRSSRPCQRLVDTDMLDGAERRRHEARRPLRRTGSTRPSASRGSSPTPATWRAPTACRAPAAATPASCTTAEAKAIIDELERMQVFYVNIGGGEPTVRPDFWELRRLRHRPPRRREVLHQRRRRSRRASPPACAAQRLRRRADLARRRHRRGQRRRARRRAPTPPRSGPWSTWPPPASRASRSPWWCTRRERRPARRVQGHRRPLRRAAAAHRGCGRRAAAADVWDELHPTADQQRELYDWLLGHGDDVLTGDSFFHLAGHGETLPGLNLCGAGRVVCLIDPRRRRLRLPVRHPREPSSPATSATRAGSAGRGASRSLFTELRAPQSGGACAQCSAYDACRGGCMAAKFFTGLPLDGPDPECVKGHGETALVSRLDPARAPLLGRPLEAEAPRAGAGGDRPQDPARLGLRRAPARRLHPTR